MEPKKVVLKVLLTGLDEEVQNWFRAAVKANGLPWRIRTCEPLRLIAPDNQASEHDIILISWDKLTPTDLSDMLTKQSPSHRSIEGMVSAIDELGGEALCRKTAVIGRVITREDALFLAEYNVRLIIPLPEKKSQWQQETNDIFERIANLHKEETSHQRSEEEREVRRFKEMLNYWEKISDEHRMESAEKLLKVLGDTPRYAELIARKCIREGDLRNAEKWLMRCLAKTPNYLRGLQLQADIYAMQGMFDESLKILDKLRANNPRSLQTLTKIGRCYAAKNEPLKAEKALSDALSIDVFYQPARDELGKVKFILKEFELARLLFSGTPTPKTLATYLNRMGIKLVSEGKYAASIEHYKWAQYVLPGNDQGHLLFFNIALALAKWGKINDALSYARLARTRDPSYDRAETLIHRLEERLAG